MLSVVVPQFYPVYGINLEFLLPFREQHELEEPDRPHVGVQVLVDFGAVLKFRKKRNASWLEWDGRTDGQTDEQTDGWTDGRTDGRVVH